ncbi:MAG: ABC-ATPase domain-containing protein [Bacteroidales bacterium]|nr:ABC-ATPase domain-containing protein [Bacteroidales bacterium]
MQKLGQILQRIDGKGYGAYKDLGGKAFDISWFRLQFTKIQADPYAPPSKLIVTTRIEDTGIPRDILDDPVQRTAFFDFLHRRFKKLNKSRDLVLPRTTQKVHIRSIFRVKEDHLQFNLKIQLPAQGRRILGRQAHSIIADELPRLLEEILLYDNLPVQPLNRHISLYIDQHYIRKKLSEEKLLAFVANNAVLPRESGVSDKPLEEAVPFETPGSMEMKMELPSGKELIGMGVPEGVTLICGGGYHGKSTLLNALQEGIYDHITGDGREYVITRDDAVKIRAEDGRSIKGLDISSFIAGLPYGKDTVKFSTENASGSTSQAANIIEAIEAGSKLMMIDEDTSATNLMIRDHRMQEFIHKSSEPIVPFIDRIRELWEDQGVSTIMVTGGVGDYLEVADQIIVMDNYLPESKMEEAQQLIANYPSKRIKEVTDPFHINTERKLVVRSINPTKGRKVKMGAKSLNNLMFGMENLNTAHLEQIAEPSIITTAGEVIYSLTKENKKSIPLVESIAAAQEKTLKQQFENLMHSDNCDYTLPRKFEVIFIANRLRQLEIQP